MCARSTPATLAADFRVDFGMLPHNAGEEESRARQIRSRLYDDPRDGNQSISRRRLLQPAVAIPTRLRSFGDISDETRRLRSARLVPLTCSPAGCQMRSLVSREAVPHTLARFPCVRRGPTAKSFCQASTMPASISSLQGRADRRVEAGSAPPLGSDQTSFRSPPR